MRSEEVDSNEQNDIIFIIVIIINIIIIIAIIIFVTACASQIFTIAFGPLLCVLLRSLPLHSDRYCVCFSDLHHSPHLCNRR